MPARFAGTVLLELRPPMASPFGLGTAFGAALGGGGGGIRTFTTGALDCDFAMVASATFDGA